MCCGPAKHNEAKLSGNTDMGQVFPEGCLSLVVGVRSISISGVVLTADTVENVFESSQNSTGAHRKASTVSWPPVLAFCGCLHTLA